MSIGGWFAIFTTGCDVCKRIDVASGHFEIGSILALDGECQEADQIRILLGDEVRRTKKAFQDGLTAVVRQPEALA
jgi:hypothetical protein